MTRLERAYPRRRTLGAVACLQCLPPREGPELQTVRPDMPRPPVRISGTQDSVGSWKVTPADRHKSREKPGRARTSSRAIGRCPLATGLFDPVEGFCRSHKTRIPCGENTMNRVSALSPPSFMMFSAAQLRDSEPSPKRLGAVPARDAQTLKWPNNCGLAAHAAAHLPPRCGTDRVPLPQFLSHLRPRMRVTVDLGEPGRVDVGVALRGRERGVA